MPKTLHSLSNEAFQQTGTERYWRTVIHRGVFTEGDGKFKRKVKCIKSLNITHIVLKRETKKPSVKDIFNPFL